MEIGNVRGNRRKGYGDFKEMITFVTTLKPFDNTVKPLQINAINSWCNLPVEKKIIINTEYKDEVEEYFKDQLDKITIIPHKTLTNTGVPYVKDIFYSAYDHTNKDDTLCYINADIILMDDFVNSVNSVLSIDEYKNTPYLMGGKRWNWTNKIEYTKLHNFSDKPKITEYVTAHIKKNGKYSGPGATDYFVHTRKTFEDKIPKDMILGRFSWDTWLVGHAINIKCNTFDLSKTAFIIHPNHGYGKNGILNKQTIKNQTIKNEIARNNKYTNHINGKTNKFKYITYFQGNDIKIKEKP